MMEEKLFDQLKVQIHDSRSALGAAAAAAVAQKINEVLSYQASINMIFAAALSQSEFLFYLAGFRTLPWNRINAFHMDEYVGLSNISPQSFGNFLKEKLFEKVPFQQVFYINGAATDVQTECKRYAGLLKQFPPDIACMGIGVNTHIAFNDPHEARFHDPVLVKTVALDEVCRRQQVDDGCFENIDKVPRDAITLTIPALMQAGYIYCMVPGANKSQAVYQTLMSEINEHHPSTILRKHAHAVLYLDGESSALIRQ